VPPNILELSAKGLRAWRQAHIIDLRMKLTEEEEQMKLTEEEEE